MRINVGETANEMGEADWQEVGAGTKGYSGADMNILGQHSDTRAARQHE